MDVDLFATTTDVNGKPLVAWQECLVRALVAFSGPQLIGGTSFEVQQRVTPLANALLKAGMDVDILLERMMGL